MRVVLDKAVTRVMDKFRKKYNDMKNEVLLETNFGFERINCQSQECAIGNLLADACLNYWHSKWEEFNLPLAKPSIAIVDPFKR